jgi:hypothetical protein
MCVKNRDNRTMNRFTNGFKNRFMRGKYKWMTQSIVRKTKFPALTRTNRFNKVEGMHQSIETWNIIENKIFHFFFTNQDFSLMYYFESTQGFSVVWDWVDSC